MKILFIDFNLPYLLRDASYPIGGATIQLHAWIKGLRDTGHHVGVLTWKGAKRFVGEAPDFDLIETYDPAKGLKVIKFAYSYLPSLYEGAARFGPDAFIQACPGLHTGMVSFIANRLKVPFLYRVSSDRDTDDRYKKRLVRHAWIAYAYGLKRANAVLCQNQYQYDRIKEKFPLKKAWILHNPFFQDVRIQPAPFDDRKYIAWLGVFKEEKNLPLLYEIARQLPSLPFKVAGMSGADMHKTTRDALTNLETLSNVVFTGYLPRDRVYPFLNGALALLNTSHNEGFSNTFLEAFSVGTPVIAPVHADPDHIIADHGLGVAVPTGEAFPDRIKELSMNRSRFTDVCRRCREYVYEHHDPGMLAVRLVEYISTVTTQSGRHAPFSM